MTKLSSSSPLKIDLHTHSTGSRDGGMTLKDYQTILDAGQLDVIAITDHDTIDEAQRIQDTIGERIIVGEEITTAAGDIIGLYLHKTIPAGLSAEAAIEKIQDQGGLVYIPHPFETIRSGLDEATLTTVADSIDIVETHNGRAFAQKRHQRAIDWAATWQKPAAASSDAHGSSGIGHTFTTIDVPPTRDTLVELLQRARLAYQPPPLRSLLYPKYHTIRKKLFSS